MADTEADTSIEITPGLRLDPAAIVASNIQRHKGPGFCPPEISVRNTITLVLYGLTIEIPNASPELVARLEPFPAVKGAN